MMAQRTRAIEHINQLTRAQSRGHRQEQCGTSSFWEELGNSWREGTLVHDLGRVGLHELKTNPFWRQRVTPKDIWQFARDLDRRVNDWFDKGIDQIVQEVEDFVDYAREHPLEASIFLSGGWVAAAANRAWQEIKAHPVEAAMIIGGVAIVAVAAIAAVASGGALLPVIIGMATGAVSGVAGQAIEDAATGQFSGWGAYVKQAAIGAVIGGVTGVIGAGASALGLPSIVTGLVSGATAGTFSQALTNVWEGRSWHEGLVQAGLTGGLGGMFAGAALGQLSPQDGLWTRMAIGSGVGGVTSGVTHALMNELAGRDWREGLGRAIAVGFTTGAMDAVTDYYGDRWQASRQVDADPRRRWSTSGVDAEGTFQRARGEPDGAWARYADEPPVRRLGDATDAPRRHWAADVPETEWRARQATADAAWAKRGETSPVELDWRTGQWKAKTDIVIDGLVYHKGNFIPADAVYHPEQFDIRIGEAARQFRVTEREIGQLTRWDVKRIQAIAEAEGVEIVVTGR